MFEVGIFYRDASNYKFNSTVLVSGELITKNNIAAGRQDIPVTELGITEQEWRDGDEYRGGYKWSEEDDHYLVDITSVEEVEHA